MAHKPSQAKNLRVGLSAFGVNVTFNYAGRAEEARLSRR